MKLSKNICLDKSQMSLKMDHVRSKTRLLANILGKPCAHYSGSIFSPLIMKLCQNVCLEISDEFKNGSKTRSLGHILEKKLVYALRFTFLIRLMKLGQNVCLHEISDEFKNGSCGVKN